MNYGELVQKLAAKGMSEQDIADALLLMYKLRPRAAELLARSATKQKVKIRKRGK